MFHGQPYFPCDSLDIWVCNVHFLLFPLQLMCFRSSSLSANCANVVRYHRYKNADDLLITHCRVVTQFWCSFITFPLYVIITQMGSRFKKSVVSEDVRNSLHGWKRRVKARQSTSSTAITHLVRTSTSSDSIVDETRKLESSSSNSSEKSSFKNENTSFRHLQGGDEKLETPLSVGPVYDSYSDDNEGDYHHDDHSNIKDELALLPP